MIAVQLDERNLCFLQACRGFLKGLLLGSAALAALPLITSTAVAQSTEDDTTTKKKKKKGTDTTGQSK